MSKKNRGKTNNTRKKRNPLTLILILLPLVATVFFAFSFFVGGAKLSGESFLATLKSPLFYVLIAAAIGGLIVYSLANFRLAEKKNVLKENDLADSHFMTDKELDGSPAFIRADLKNLEKFADGIPIRAVVRGKKTEVVFKKEPIHANVIGATGTGKTTCFVDPVIQLFPRFKTKPSLVITDPKGELFRKHSKFLKGQGYTVLCVDYRHPYESAKVNPFSPVLDRIREIRTLVQNKAGKYIVTDKVYATYPEAENAAKARRQILRDEINLYLDDIAQTLFPTEDKNQPSWEDGARDLILALFYALTDDVIAGRMPEEKLCLHNIYYLLSNYSSESGVEELRIYFDAHKENLTAFSKAQTVLTSTDRALSSFISTMMRFVNYLADAGVRCMTSGNDVSFSAFDKEPTAIFVIYPDELISRHRFVALFLIQIYKQLVATAEQNMRLGLTDDMKLLRNCYFVMDEFGNLPKLQRFDDITSIARSRRIFFLCVLQSYTQLDTVYTEKSAEKILSQLQIKIYIGTDDMKTLKAFSELCGKKKIVTLSASVALGREANDSYSAKEQPLITPQELQLLCQDNSGNAVVSCLGQYPLRSSFTPSYKAKEVYSIGDAKDDLRQTEIFEEKKFEQDLHALIPAAGAALQLEAPDDAPESTLTPEEIEALNAEEYRRDAAEKAQNKIQTLYLQRDAKLSFIENFLPDGVCDAIRAAASRDVGAVIEQILDRETDLILTVRLELSWLKTLYSRILEAENEYKNLNLFDKEGVSL
jgi:type IV secretion system protein VirD4